MHKKYLIATCTGTLISRSVIITAGHCAGEDKELIFKEVKFLRQTSSGPTPYLTLPATSKLFTKVDPDEYFLEHRVLKDDENAYADIALFALNYSLPVCNDDANDYAVLRLPIANINDSKWIPENGSISDCRMLGFGAYENGLQGETLRVLQLSLRDHQTVLYTQALPGQEYGRAYDKQQAIRLESLQYWHLLKFSKAILTHNIQADSGGPVMCELDNNGPRLIGITSFSFKELYEDRRRCFAERRPMMYDVYVNVRRVLPVIRSGLEAIGKLDEFIEDFNKCSRQ
ncbi:unnamed protein product [Anisakis simplex]|uniref:Peptidase S1 domain-containing protein n=1 Tax=Anisakis simplex TaxID=6269 RepID=A0A0M3K4N4_ANISI|nr:unnamed protein product [Anisakis simplex]